MSSLHEEMNRILRKNNELYDMLYPDLEKFNAPFEDIPTYEFCEWDGEMIPVDEVYTEASDEVVFHDKSCRTNYMKEKGTTI